MFNLFVGYAAWEEGQETVDRSRIFEYTEDSVAAQHKSGSNLELDKLTRLPCLFMPEGRDDEEARVGRISSAREYGGKVIIEYSYDPDILPLKNSEIYKHRLEFDMPHDFEFSRTHWAVKDIDLFRVLLRLMKPRRQKPKVFDIPDSETIDPNLVSVMMPFDAEFIDVYTSIQQSAETVGLRCRRADEIWENPSIIQDIVSLIDRSFAVVCDCTRRNPNVFYEIGIAHSLGREVILIAQNEQDVPFDLRHLRYIPYLNNNEGREALGGALSERLHWLQENN